MDGMGMTTCIRCRGREKSWENRRNRSYAEQKLVNKGETSSRHSHEGLWFGRITRRALTRTVTVAHIDYFRYQDEQ